MTDDGLSPSDRRVVALVAQGLTYREIADVLDRTIGSVRVQVWRVSLRLPGPGSPKVRMTRWHYTTTGDA